MLVSSGATRLAVEDPCADDDAVPVARAAGLEVVGVPVGDDGVGVDALDRIDADALVLTPSHQWPTGAVLSPERRAAVLRWAQQRGALIVEDDYDAEYRYDRAPIGAMQGLAPDRVVYAGTASKTLAPGLRLGWLVVPPRLVDAVAEAKALADRGSPVLDQLAFADFLARGEFDRHLRRMRPALPPPPRRAARALRDQLPELEPAGHRRRPAPGRLPARRPRRGRGRRRPPPRAASPSTASRPTASHTTGRPGLIFGYATLGERTIAEGIATLADVIRASRGPARSR